MFEILVISLLILSHVLADFYFQTDKLVKQKEKSNLYMVWHVSHFLLCALILTMPFFSFTLLLVTVGITIVHYVIDKIKIYVQHKKNRPLHAFLSFITDQIAHILVIIGMYPFLKDVAPHSFAKTIVESVVMSYPFLEALSDVNLLAYLILVIAALLFSIRGGTILTLLIIQLPNENNHYERENKVVQTNVGDARNEIAATVDSFIGNDPHEHYRQESLKRYGKVIVISKD